MESKFPELHTRLVVTTSRLRFRLLQGQLGIFYYEPPLAGSRRPLRGRLPPEASLYSSALALQRRQERQGYEFAMRLLYQFFALRLVNCSSRCVQ